jgi:DNA-binding NarL/FixJ family response regulator
MRDEKLRILLVDDQDLIRTGFSLILGTQADFAVVGEAGDGAKAL